MSSNKRPLPCRKCDLVWIFWQDTSGGSDRCHIEDSKNLHSVVNCNIGWIVAENEEVVRLAYGEGTSREIDYMDILKNNIIERVLVSPSRKK